MWIIRSGLWSGYGLVVVEVQTKERETCFHDSIRDGAGCVRPG